MKLNIGIVDRLIRSLLASAAFYLGLVRYSSSGLGSGLTVAGIVLLLTALIGSCPLYRLLRIRTTRPMRQL